MKNKKIEIIIKKVQELQNKYVFYKKNKKPLFMLLTMWEIGDFLKKNGINKPHSLGWAIEEKRAYISRPMIFRSFVIRRIWGSKNLMKKQLYGVKSVNSVIEMFPFLDQNSKWKLPKEKLNYLLSSLSTKPAKEFNKVLLDMKRNYIGIKTNREIHFREIEPLKYKFTKFQSKIKDVLENSQINNCLKFADNIGKENLKNLAKISLDLSIDREFNIKEFNFEKSNNQDFEQLISELIKVCSNKQRRKIVKRIIKPSQLGEMVDYCNSILEEESIKAYKARENSKFSI